MNYKHGMRGTPEYGAWVSMRERCSNPKCRNYARYGGRGIAVCERWNSFELFFADMGRRPSPDHSIDRKGNEGPYAPWNCRWATRETQSNNRRSSLYVVYRGKRMTFAEANRLAGVVSYITAHGRIKKRGWDVERAVETPTQLSVASARKRAARRALSRAECRP